MATRIPSIRCVFLVLAWTTALSCFCQGIEPKKPQDVSRVYNVSIDNFPTGKRHTDRTPDLPRKAIFNRDLTTIIGGLRSKIIKFPDFLRTHSVSSTSRAVEKSRLRAQKLLHEQSYPNLFRKDYTTRRKNNNLKMEAVDAFGKNVYEKLERLNRIVRPNVKNQSHAGFSSLLSSSLSSSSKVKSKLQEVLIFSSENTLIPSQSSLSLLSPSSSSNERVKSSNSKSFIKTSSSSVPNRIQPQFLSTSSSSSSSLSSSSHHQNTTDCTERSPQHSIIRRDVSSFVGEATSSYFDSSLFLDSDGRNSTGNNSERITLHIGGLFELTGNRYGGNGHSELLATQMAIEHVNHLGVIPGYRLELLYNDSQDASLSPDIFRQIRRDAASHLLLGGQRDQCFEIDLFPVQECDPGVGTDAFYDLVYRKSRHSTLMMVMGGACNEVTKTLAEIVNYWNIVMISYAADSPALSTREKYKTFFRMDLGHSALDPPRRMLLEHFKWEKVAVLYEELEALSLAFNTFRKGLASHGITVTSAESLKNAQVETPAKLRKLKDQDVRIIVAGFSETVARRVFCEAYKMGLTGSRYVWILLGGLKRRWWLRDQEKDTSCTTEELSKAVEGMFTVFGLNGMLGGETSIGNLTYSDFLREYNSLNGSHPVTMFTVISYDIVWTMALAIRDTLQQWENNGTALPLHQLNYSQMNSVKDGFINSVESLSFSGVSGPVSFVGPDREGVSVVYQLQDGNYTPVALHTPLSSSLDFDCDLCKPVIWAAGKVPKDAQRIVPRMKVILPSVFYPAVALCMGGILMAVFFLGYNLYYRRLKFIKLSSPNLNNVAVLGCIMAYCDVILLGLDDTNLTNHAYSIVCTARAFLLSSGFSLAFGAMFAKTFRVHRIFTRANRGLLKSRLIRDSHLLVIIGVLLVLDMGLVCTWVVVDPMTRVVYNLTQQVSEDDPDLVYQEQLTTCFSNHLQEWLGAFYGYKGLLLVFGLYMAWETRHVKIPALNDSQYIGLNVYNVVIMAVCVVVISNIVSTRPNLAYGMVASFMILSTTVTLCLLFVPKICAIVASKGNPIVASSGILVDRSNTRRFVFDDRKEVLYRAEVQNRVYKREIMELGQKICRLERLLDIPIHPIPRLTEELLYLLPQTLGERAPLGFRRGRRRALEWCNSISDGGEGVTWSVTDSEDLNTDTSLLSPLSPGHSSGKSSTKPTSSQHRQHNRKLATNHGGKSHKPYKLNLTGGRDKRTKTERCLSPCSLGCKMCAQGRGGLQFHNNSSSPFGSGKSSSKGSTCKSYRKDVCRRNHKRKEKESSSRDVHEKGVKDLNYSMVHQSLKLLKLTVPAVPFPDRIDQARSLPEIFETMRKESLDESLMDSNEMKTASSDHAVTNSTSVSSSLASPKKICEELRIEIPCTQHHTVDIGDIHTNQFGNANIMPTDLCDNDNDVEEDDHDDDSDDDEDDVYEVKYSSQLSPSQSWPVLDFKDDAILWERQTCHGHRLPAYKNSLLEHASVFSVSEFQIASFDDGDLDDNDALDYSGDENGNDVFDSDRDVVGNDDVTGECGNCNNDLCQNRPSSSSLNKNDNFRDILNIRSLKEYQNQNNSFQYQRLEQDNSTHRKHHNSIQLPNFHKRKKELYLPLNQPSFTQQSKKSESCPRVNEPNYNLLQIHLEDASNHTTQLHYSDQSLAHTNRNNNNNNNNNWLRYLFKPKHRHQPFRDTTNKYSSIPHSRDDDSYQNNNTPCLSNRLFDHRASDPLVPNHSTTYHDEDDDLDRFSERTRLIPPEPYDDPSPSSVSTLTTWQSCSAIEPRQPYSHCDNNSRKSSLPANKSPSRLSATSASNIQSLSSNIQSLSSNIQSLSSNIQSLSSNAQSLSPNVQSLTNCHPVNNSCTNTRAITNTNYYNNGNISQVVSPRPQLYNENLNSPSCFSSPRNESSSLLSLVSSNSSSTSSCHGGEGSRFEISTTSGEEHRPPSIHKPPHTSSDLLVSAMGHPPSSSSPSSSLSSSSRPQQSNSSSRLSSCSHPQTVFSDGTIESVTSVINNNPFSVNQKETGVMTNPSMLWPLSDRTTKSSIISGIGTGKSEFERYDEVSEF